MGRQHPESTATRSQRTETKTKASDQTRRSARSMRRRFAIPLIAAMAFLPWYWLMPKPTSGIQQAELISVLDLEGNGDWFGGLSGFDLTSDGETFHLVTDRGHRATGTLTRDGDELATFSIEQYQPLLDSHGRQREFPLTDAEGVALAEDGTVYVSFEHSDRVLYYPSWDSPAEWPGYTRAWRAIGNNQGLEALAIDANGTLYTLPEAILSGASESLVYRRKPGGKWTQPFTIPVHQNFKPVGADFGPDGRFYLLERGLYPFGFYSRVRSMRIRNDEVTDIVTELETPFARHGNLEGLSVWQDARGNLRLTMVSDNNFWFFMRSQLVEYKLSRRVAQPTQ